jgi:hypothetical protein
MLHTLKAKALIRSIMGLFVTKKPNITRLNHRDVYFKCYFFPENLCNGIGIVAKIERTSKRRSAVLLMAAGLSSYMGEKITEQIKLNTAARERNEKTKRTRFAFIL